MKKLLAAIMLGLIIGLQLTAGIALAEPATPSAPATDEQEQQQSQPASATESKVNKLLPQFDVIPIEQQGIGDEITNYSNLTDADWTQIVASAIKTMLFAAGALVLIGLLVVGAMFLTGASNEENITKARKILIYLVIGIILISVSYAVVSGISQFKLGG
jgi:hypothetical protein